jgi:hypothetical protein
VRVTRFESAEKKNLRARTRAERTMASGTRAPASVLSPGFGEMQVPEMPAYVQSYSSRGSAYPWQTTPVMSQTRFGNRTGVGGMAAYLSQAEDPGFFEGARLKAGEPGVFETERWAPGYDWRGGFGVASLAANKNAALSTRGGGLRGGGPRRADLVGPPPLWNDTIRPGIGVSRYVQTNENYSGVYENRKITPPIERQNDMFVLREMIEHNPFNILSHAAGQAKRAYDEEFGQLHDRIEAAYDPGITDSTAAYGDRTIEDHDPRWVAPNLLT